MVGQTISNYPVSDQIGPRNPRIPLSCRLGGPRSEVGHYLSAKHLFFSDFPSILPYKIQPEKADRGHQTGD